VARANHDLQYSKELDTFAGFEYNDCCLRVAFLARRSLRVDYTTPDFLANVTNKDYEPGVLLDFELKGLGGVVEQVSSLLNSAIPGYKTRHQNVR
jgi:LPS-assembly protein